MDHCLCYAADTLDRSGVVFADRLQAHVQVHAQGLIGPPPTRVVFWWQRKQSLLKIVYKPHPCELDLRAEKCSHSCESNGLDGPGAGQPRWHYWRPHRRRLSSCAFADRECFCWAGPSRRPVKNQLLVRLSVWSCPVEHLTPARQEEGLQR